MWFEKGYLLRVRVIFIVRHYTYPPFDVSVILLNQVVQIFAFSEGNRFFIGFVGVENGQNRCAGTAFINSHHLRLTVVSDSLTKETQCSGRILSGGQQEVDGLTCSINPALSHYLFKIA
jgi:hypothetical protein